MNRGELDGVPNQPRLLLQSLQCQGAKAAAKAGMVEEGKAVWGAAAAAETAAEEMVAAEMAVVEAAVVVEVATRAATEVVAYVASMVDRVAVSEA